MKAPGTVSLHGEGGSLSTVRFSGQRVRRGLRDLRYGLLMLAYG